MATATLPAQAQSRGLLDDHRVGEAMTPGVVTISEAASLDDLTCALAHHQVEAVLVVGRDGSPQGWASWGAVPDPDKASSSKNVSAAISEPITAIDPDTSLRAALYALSLAGVSHLLVRPRGDQAGVGVLTRIDL